MLVWLLVAVACVQAPRGALADSSAPLLAGTVERSAETAASDAAAPTSRETPAPRPSDPFDLAAWLDYKQRNHIDALPYQARLFHRRGLILHESGDEAEALRIVHGAAELDPSYVAPHLTMASWSLMSDPSQALLQYAVVLDLGRDNFLMQLGLLANTLYLVLQAIVIGLLVTGLIILAVHQSQLRHAWMERLAGFTSAVTARWWAWALLVLPFMLGLGPVIPTVLLLGLLWPMLKFRERFVFVALVACLASAPLMIAALDRLAVPLRSGQPPLHGITLVENDVDRPGQRERLAALAEAEPDNPFVHFALAWTSRRAGDMATAEEAYRHVLELWPDDDRVLNNLGNTLAMEGRPEEALDLYRRAAERNPENAPAHFNMSQILTRQFDYQSATNALSRASALDFDMVKVYQARQTDDGFLPLVDQWIEPQRVWTVLSTMGLGGVDAPSLPPIWRSRIEFSGWVFSAAIVLLAILSAWIGTGMNRAIALRSCSNCGGVVCRRCAERRRELALCPTCAALEAQAESEDFARVLLRQHKRSHEVRRNLARTAFATLVPGLGLVRHDRTMTALALLTCGAGLGLLAAGLAGPFPLELDLARPGAAIPTPILIGAAILLYAFSLGSYFALLAKARAQAEYLARPQRSRTTQVGNRPGAAAA